MDVNFIWIGYYKKDNHDKVWGIMSLNETTKGKDLYSIRYNIPVHVFWGGRGKSIAFKADTMSPTLAGLTSSKERKGYRQINEAKLRQIWPDFDNTLKQRLTLHILSQ